MCLVGQKRSDGTREEEAANVGTSIVAEIRERTDRRER